MARAASFEGGAMADDELSPISAIRATLAGFIARPGVILANRYEILEYVGRGGMGVVYKAHDRTLDETVAVKLLRQQPFDDPVMAQRFLAEIKLARRVTHRNVCRIHDYGEAHDVRFISMQFVEGIELGQLVRNRGRLGADEGYDIALQLVDGLEAIHDQAIVHRDLKTSNVMIDRRGIALLMVRLLRPVDVDVEPCQDGALAQRRDWHQPDFLLCRSLAP